MGLLIALAWHTRCSHLTSREVTYDEHRARLRTMVRSGLLVALALGVTAGAGKTAESGHAASGRRRRTPEGGCSFDESARPRRGSAPDGQMSVGAAQRRKSSYPSAKSRQHQFLPAFKDTAGPAWPRFAPAISASVTSV